MKFARFAVVSLGIWLASAAPASAQPPGKDTLPTPKELPGQPTIVSFRIVPGPQHGQRNVWELYSVDSRGRFQPRVVMDPRGYYYLSNGNPYGYPWAEDRLPILHALGRRLKISC